MCYDQLVLRQTNKQSLPLSQRKQCKRKKLVSPWGKYSIQGSYFVLLLEESWTIHPSRSLHAHLQLLFAALICTLATVVTPSEEKTKDRESNGKKIASRKEAVAGTAALVAYPTAN